MSIHRYRHYFTTALGSAALAAALAGCGLDPSATISPLGIRPGTQVASADLALNPSLMETSTTVAKNNSLQPATSNTARALLATTDPQSNTPFYDLVADTREEVRVLHDASELLIHDCMKRAGQSYAITAHTDEWYPYRPFGTEPGDTEPLVDDNGPTERQMPDAWMEAAWGTHSKPGCFKQAHDAIYTSYDAFRAHRDDYFRIRRLAFQAAFSVRESKPYQDALVVWQKCMKASGSQAPDPSQLHPRYAAMDLECKDKSQLLAIAHRLVRQKETGLVMQHADDIKSLRRQHQEHVLRAEKVVGQHT